MAETKQNPVVTIRMEDGKEMKVELYPQKAPNTVANFLSLVQAGFYNGLTFHRIIDGFMIQGGDPNGTGMGGPGYSIGGEFAANGDTRNDISHQVGVISMARSRSFDSAGSQFFICVGDASFLDGQYAAFGKTVDAESAAVAVALSKVPTGLQDRPLRPVTIRCITAETFGVTYDAPQHA